MTPLKFHPARPLALLLVLVLLAGCATRGPNHLYYTNRADPAVHDLGGTAAQTVPGTAAGEQVLGLAYDFNTDHLFLRIAPAQVIRVIERPSGKILREMPLPAELQAENYADLAIRSSDRHLFAVHPDGHSVVELTLFGAFVRHIALPGLAAPIRGLAFDQHAAHLLVLADKQVHAFTTDGRETGQTTLNAPVQPTSLSYDSDARHYFVPLSDGNSVGEFDADGKLLTTIETGPVTTLGAGPRSFVRVF